MKTALFFLVLFAPLFWVHANDSHLPTLKEALRDQNSIKKVRAQCPLFISQATSPQSDSHRKLIDSLKIECGALKSPLNHIKNKEDEFISLSYLFISSKATEEVENKPLLIIENGGPSSSSLELATQLTLVAAASEGGFPSASQLLKKYNVLAIEQRGALLTFPNGTCRAYSNFRVKNNYSNLSTEKLIQGETEALESCQKQLPPSFLKNISTYQIAQDLVYGAQFFGYSTFNYYAVSYGTLVGQYLMKFNSDKLNKVILDSAVVPGQDWVVNAYKITDIFFQAGLDLVIEKLLSSVGADYTQYNDIKKSQTRTQVLSKIKSFSEYIRKNPIQIDIILPSQDKLTLQFNEKIYQTLIMDSLVVRKDLHAAQQLISLQSQHFDNASPQRTNIITNLKTLIEDTLLSGLDTPRLQYQSILCREFAPPQISPEQIHWPLLSTILSPKQISNYAKKESSRCTLDLPQHTTKENPVIRTPFSSPIPAVILGGTADPITPISNIEKLKVLWPQALPQVFDGVQHSVTFQKSCIYKSVVDYFVHAKKHEFKNLCK